MDVLCGLKILAKESQGGKIQRKKFDLTDKYHSCVATKVEDIVQEKDYPLNNHYRYQWMRPGKR